MNPASAYTLPVPNVKWFEAARVRANQYAPSARPIAPAWDAMCQPSAVSASEPVISPAISSAIIVRNVIATTHAVRRSPRVAATARSPWWACSAGAWTACSGAVTRAV